MELQRVTFSGPPIDDEEILGRLPRELAGILGQINGFIQFGGGLHIRWACLEPAWHSLRDAWLGDESFARLYPGVVKPKDVPFGEDCLGDQFLLRRGKVWKLYAEFGELKALGVSFAGFLGAAQADPVGFLSMNPLVRFCRDGGTLEPGQLLSAIPPFCTKESGGRKVSLRAVSAGERRRFLADLSRQIQDVADGDWIEFKVVNRKPRNSIRRTGRR